MVLFFLLPFIGISQTKGELQKKREKLSQQIKYTEKLLSEASASKKNTEGHLKVLNKKISLRKELVSTIGSQVKKIDNEVEVYLEEISNLENDITDLKKEYADMIYYAYQNKDGYDKLMYIFASESFYQAYKRMKYLQDYAEYRRGQVEFINKIKQERNVKIAELEDKRKAKVGVLEEKQSELTNLSSDKKEQYGTLKVLQQEEKSLRKKLRQQEADKKKINKAIERIIKKELEEARKKNNGVYTLSGEGIIDSENFERNKGQLPWPVAKGLITGLYGTHPHAVLKGVSVENNGMDFTTERNAECRAVYDGEVTSVFTIPGIGKNVIVSHGAYRTVYTNISETFVQKGDKVKLKQAIGKLAEIDGKTVAHIEVWKITEGGVTKQNPGIWLAK